MMAGLTGADLGGTGGASEEADEMEEYGEALSIVASCGTEAEGAGVGLRYPLHIQDSLDPTLLVAEGGADSTSALMRWAWILLLLGGGPCAVGLMERVGVGSTFSCLEKALVK